MWDVWHRFCFRHFPGIGARRVSAVGGLNRSSAYGTAGLDAHQHCVGNRTPDVPWRSQTQRSSSFDQSMARFKPVAKAGFSRYRGFDVMVACGRLVLVCHPFGDLALFLPVYCCGEARSYIQPLGRETRCRHSILCLEVSTAEHFVECRFPASRITVSVQNQKNRYVPSNQTMSSPPQAALQHFAQV